MNPSTACSITALTATLGLAACSSQSSNDLPLPPHAERATRSERPAGAPVIHVFSAGKTPGFPSRANAYDITAGPDGAMWFTDSGTRAIGKLSTDGHVTEYTTGLPFGAEPYDIIAGPDGNLWFSDLSGAIGRITRQGTIDEFGVGKPASKIHPSGIVVGGDGAIWSNAPGPPNELVRCDLKGHISTYKTPAGYTQDGSLGADASGNLWMMAQKGQYGIMLERRTNGEFVAHHTGLIASTLPCCPNEAPVRIAIAANGDPWFTALYWSNPKINDSVVGTMAGPRATLFPVDESAIRYSVYPSGIARRGDDVWFIGDDPFQINGALWRITPGGKQQVYQIAFNPIALAADAAGKLWFTAEAFGYPSEIVEATFP